MQGRRPRDGELPVSHADPLATIICTCAAADGHDSVPASVEHRDAPPEPTPSSLPASPRRPRVRPASPTGRRSWVLRLVFKIFMLLSELSASRGPSDAGPASSTDRRPRIMRNPGRRLVGYGGENRGSPRERSGSRHCRDCGIRAWAGTSWNCCFRGRAACAERPACRATPARIASDLSSSWVWAPSASAARRRSPGIRRRTRTPGLQRSLPPAHRHQPRRHPGHGQRRERLRHRWLRPAPRRPSARPASIDHPHTIESSPPGASFPR